MICPTWTCVWSWVRMTSQTKLPRRMRTAPFMSSGQGKDVPDHEWGGGNPVNVSSVVHGGNFPSFSRDSLFGNPEVSSSGVHGQIGECGQTSDHHGQNFEKSVFFLGHGSFVEVCGGHCHANQTNKDARHAKHA